MTFLSERVRPWLIQRMRRRPANDPQAEKYAGPDRLWVMELMGAAEFEFGALPEALRRMALVRGQLEVSSHEVGGHTLWALGLRAHKETISSLLAYEITRHGEPWRFKEHTAIRTALNLDGHGADPDMAWWALDAWVSPFVIFQAEQDPHSWLERLGVWAEMKGLE